MNDKYTVTAFSFWDFCLAVQDAVSQGYVFSDSNENMPQAYVGSYSCVMIKPETTNKVDDLDKPQVANKTGRKTTTK